VNKPKKITGDAIWTGDSLGGKETLCFDLEPHHLKVIDNALQTVRQRNLATQSVSMQDFDLSAISDDMTRLVNGLKHDRGLLIVRGFPIAKYTIPDMETIFWGFGLHFGSPVSQSVLGDRLGHVIDATDVDPDARGYRNHDELSLHTDFADVVAFMCMRKAKSGGTSWFSSALGVHNELLASDPDLLEILYRGFPWFRSGEHAYGSESITPWRVPVFSECEGLVSCRYVRDYICEGAAQDGGTTLTENEVQAIDAFDRASHREGTPVKFQLEPGEAVFINNLTVLHARTSYTDHDMADEKRLLLRLWTKMQNGRPTVPELKIFDGENEHGIPQQSGRTPSFARRTQRKSIAEVSR
jgi:hypothetical protein